MNQSRQESQADRDEVASLHAKMSKDIPQGTECPVIIALSISSQVKIPSDASCPSAGLLVGLSVGWSVITSVLLSQERVRCF